MSCSFCLRLSRENEIRWTCPSPWILRIISQSKYSLRRVTGRAGTLCERSSVYRLQRGTVVVVLVKHLEANLLYYDPVAACLSKMHSCTCDLRNLNWCRIFNRISTVIVSHCVCVFQQGRHVKTGQLAAIKVMEVTEVRVHYLTTLRVYLCRVWGNAVSCSKIILIYLYFISTSFLCSTCSLPGMSTSQMHPFMFKQPEQHHKHQTLFVPSHELPDDSLMEKWG